MPSVPALSRSLGIAAIAVLAGCAASPRKEKAEVRELSFHAYDEGEKFAEAKNYTLALDRYSRSAEIDARPAVYLQMARVNEQMGQKEDAAEAYFKALQMSPDYPEARFGLIGLGFEPPAADAVAAHPELLDQFGQKLTEELELRRAETEHGKGELSETERAALRESIRARKTLAATNRKPTLSEVRAVLFPAAGAPESVPSATDPTYATDRSIILNTYPYHFANGQRFQKKNEFERAAAEYQAALNADPNQIEARLNLGDVMLKLERFPQAQFHYSKAMDQFPDSARPVLKMGNYFDSLKRTDMAREYYKKAIDKTPDYTEAYNNLAAIAIREQKFPEAIDLLNRATKIDPNYALGYLNLGVAQENSGDKKAAAASYRKYVELGGERAPEVRKWIAEME